MIRLKVAETSNGLEFVHGRQRCPVEWPEGTWSALPPTLRATLADNLAHLLTIDLPFAAGASGIALDRPRPCFWTQFRVMVLGGIPQAVERSKRSTTKTLEKFRALRYEFSSDVPRMPAAPRCETRERAVVIFSPDADSLATLGLAREMGLDPIALGIDDGASPAKSRALVSALDALKAAGFGAELIVNRAGALVGKKPAQLGCMHESSAAALLALPVAYAASARYISVPADQDNNFSFANHDGFLTYPAFDRTSGWVIQLDLLTRTLTEGAIRTMSLVEPLTGFGVMRTLAQRYPGLAKMLLDCEAPGKSGACADCAACARAGLFARAAGAEAGSVGPCRAMTDARDARFYAIFGGRDVAPRDLSEEAREQEELAFYLAIARGFKGPLVRRFKARFHDELRRDDLLARHLSLFPPGTVATDLRERLLRILREATGQAKTLF